MGDDGNRQVALTVDQIAIAVGLNAVQFQTLLDLWDLQLDGINGAINKLAENISEPDTSVAAEVRSLKQEVVVGFSGLQQSIANLNNTIHERSVDLAKWLAAIALAASTPEDNSAAVQAEIDKITAETNASTDKVEEAIKQVDKGE